MIILLLHGAHQFHNLWKLSFAHPFAIFESKAIVLIGRTIHNLIFATTELIIFNLDDIRLVQSILKHHLQCLLFRFNKLLWVYILHHFLYGIFGFLRIAFLFLNDKASLDEWEVFLAD